MPLPTPSSQLGRFKEALAAFEEALRLDPGYAVAQNNKQAALKALSVEYVRKGRKFRNAGQFEEALLAFEEAVRYNPHNAQAYTFGGHALYDLKRYEEAHDAYKVSLSLNPQQAEVYYMIGATLYCLDRLEEAYEACRVALQLDQNYADAETLKKAILKRLRETEGWMTSFIVRISDFFPE